MIDERQHRYGGFSRIGGIGVIRLSVLLPRMAQDTIDLNRLGDMLDPVRAHVLERAVQLLAGLLVMARALVAWGRAGGGPAPAGELRRLREQACKASFVSPLGVVDRALGADPETAPL